jgi:hypothetical protein
LPDEQVNPPLYSDIAALLNEIEHLRVDARRYRKLVASCSVECDDGTTGIEFFSDFENWDNLDAAVDALPEQTK